MKFVPSFPRFLPTGRMVATPVLVTTESCQCQHEFADCPAEPGFPVPPHGKHFHRFPVNVFCRRTIFRFFATAVVAEIQ